MIMSEPTQEPSENVQGLIYIQKNAGCPESVCWDGTLTYPSEPKITDGSLSRAESNSTNGYYFIIGDTPQTLYTFENMSLDQHHPADITIELTRTEKTASTTKSEQVTIEVEWIAGKDGGATALFKGSPDNIKTDDAGLDLKISCG